MELIATPASTTDSAEIWQKRDNPKITMATAILPTKAQTGIIKFPFAALPAPKIIIAKAAPKPAP